MALAGSPFGEGTQRRRASAISSAPMEVPVTRLLTNHWFWILAFVLSWIVMITILIADGYGAATGR
jgi:hypothetical protein